MSMASMNKAMRQANSRRASGNAGVERRRQEEDVLESYRNLTKEDFRLKNLAQWEHHTHQAIQRNQLARVADGLLHDRNHRIEERRSALKDLLTAENNRLKLELDSLRESPLDRRERLRARAQEIRMVKDEESKAFIAEQLRRQFRATCDDLRHAEGRNLMIICERDRHQQSENKVMLKSLAEKEEEKWDHLWEQDRQLKIEREAEEVRLRKLMNLKTYEQIDQQVGALKQRRAQQQAQKEEDTRMRLDMMKMEEQKSIEDHQDQLALAAARRMEVAKFNKMFQERKAAERRQAEEEDKKLLVHVLNQEAIAVANEQDDKASLAADMKAYLLYRQQERADQQAMEKELDALRAIELKKVSDKQDLVWHKEQLARDKLMKEVLESRHMQLLEKAEKSSRDRKELEWERQQLLKQLAEDSNDGIDLHTVDIEAKAEMATTLRNQMEDNKYRREMDRAEQFYEMRAAQLAEEQYQKQLHVELEIDRQNIGKVPPNHGLKQMIWN